MASAQHAAPSTQSGQRTAAHPVAPARRPAHPRDDLLRIQRRLGNRGARPVIQAKLVVGPVDDPHEREADRISRLAMGTSAADVGAADESVQRAPEHIGHVHGGGAGVADPGVERAVARARGGGGPVPDGVRRRMERVTGADLGEARVHVDAEADRLTDALGARAFTVGADVFVRRSEYRPGTAGGDALLGHELTHVVQQRGADATVQRLIRANYPWRGVVTNPAGADVYQNAAGPAGNVLLATTQPGEIVNVVGGIGVYLDVRSWSGNGYVAHQDVDDATTAQMDAGLGPRLRWKNSGATGTSTQVHHADPTRVVEIYGTDFAAWALGKGGEWLWGSGVRQRTTTLNCWEAVLFAAYRVGAIDWAWLHALYTGGAANPAQWFLDQMVNNRPLTNYVINVQDPERGDLVFFDGLGHVALAAGWQHLGETVVYSFWPAPDVDFSDSYNGTADQVKLTTIEALSAAMQAWGPAPLVQFARPVWSG
jgi:hypothetical protein